MQSETMKLSKRLKEIKAIDIMSKFAITTRDDESVESLAHLMMRFKISGMPVVSKKSGEICGIVTATDLFNLIKAIIQDIDNGLESSKYQELKVSEIMTKDVISINEKTSLFEIVKIMCDKNIHTLPVKFADENAIAGVIGRRDILNAFYVGSKKQIKVD